MSPRGWARALIVAAAWLCAQAALAPAALAQADLKIMAPAAPGGGWDQTARSMQRALVESGAAHSVQVNNVGGAGGTVGLAQFVNGARGDPGQLLVNGLVMVGAILNNKAPVTLEQTTPIARLTSEPLVVVVPAASAIRTAKDLADQIRADPGRVRWAGGSAGGIDHISAGLFARAAGADPTRINYIPFSGGGEALAAMLGGRVTAGISGYGEFEGQIKAGKLRAVAVTSANRIAGVEVPTLKEQGIDLEIENWRAVVAPPGITPEQRQALIAAVETMVRSPAWADILKARGWSDAFLPGDAFSAFLAAETTRIAEVLRSVLGRGTAYGLGPTAMPLATGVALGLLALGHGVVGFREGFPKPTVAADPVALLWLTAGLVGLIAAIGSGLGFIPATTWVFAATARAFGRRALLVDLLIGAALGLAIYLLFNKLLTLSLPQGPLERLL